MSLVFPQGVQFSKARVRGEVSATTDAYNREMCERMGSDIKYQHEWGMNYSHILPTLIVGSMPQDAGDISYLRNHLGVSAILNLQQEKVCHANLLHGVISNICCWQAALTKLCAFDRTGKSLT
mmetsp:Transcript_37885/g.107036  ORF Transcript_37885/g.107036 Transcript_37885/m.107036 type:complete len:123 (+) Transcript_37885:549-917(+)